MNKYEYKEIKLDDEDKLLEIIKKEGQNGWELVSKKDGEEIWNPVYGMWDGWEPSTLIFKKIKITN
jgi:hypothetical protein